MHLCQVQCEVTQWDIVVTLDASCLPAVLATLLVRFHPLVILIVGNKYAVDKLALLEGKLRQNALSKQVSSSIQPVSSFCEKLLLLIF